MEYTKSMRVCFVTEQKSVCRVIINRLNDFGYHGYIQDDWLGLDNDLHSAAKKVDLLVCDFSYAGNASVNFFDIVKQTGNNVPVIFYNDPLPDDEERVAWWIMQNENAYNTILPKDTVEFFVRLNSLICDSKSGPTFHFYSRRFHSPTKTCARIHPTANLICTSSAAAQAFRLPCSAFLNTCTKTAPATLP